MLNVASKFVASSGAAAILGDGQTIHNLLRIPISLNKKLTPSWFVEAEKRLGKTKLLVLDEISLVSPRLLEALDFRLRALKRNDIDFGGLHVIALGDMFQLKVVSDLPFYEGAVNHAASSVVSLSQALAPRLDEDRGIQLFCSLRRIELTTQHRCKDSGHKELIRAIRDPDVLRPLTMDVIDQIGELTEEDALKECWRRAIYVCQTNAERRMYNEFGVKRFAVQTHQPVLYWVCPQGGSKRNIDSHERLQGGQNLYGLGYETHCYFVRGMPVQITENISVRDGIANGADAVMVSVTCRPTNSVSGRRVSLPPLDNLAVGQEFQIALPYSVNVVLQRDWDEAVQSHRLENGVASGTEVDVRKVKVPKNCLIALPIHSVYPATGSKHKKFRWLGHSCTPGFCLTYWKIQGRTVARNLIVAADKTRGGGSGLTLAQVYVALSRVTALANVKFMPMQSGRAEELTQLIYPHTLKMWARNYTPGTVRIEVDGRLDAAAGVVVDVRCLDGLGGPLDRGLEIFSSDVLEDTTALVLCSPNELVNVVGVVHHGRKYRCRGAPNAPVDVGSSGQWKMGGLRTEFRAAEVATMDVLSKYKRFETGQVPQAVLRTLCSRLSIRYCTEDRVKLLVQRLTPTWIRARARRKLMDLKWTKEAVQQMGSSLNADLIRHVDRHEWCPVCKGPSFNKFFKKSVGGHRRIPCKQSERFSRRCGDVVVSSRQHGNLARVIGKQMKVWTGQHAFAVEAPPTPPRTPVRGSSVASKSTPTTEPVKRGRTDDADAQERGANKRVRTVGKPVCGKRSGDFIGSVRPKRARTTTERLSLKRRLFCAAVSIG